MKIISGGQTGADQGGLNTAIKMGIEHGGWCPKGRKSEDGPIPKKYNLQETEDSGYLERTRKNIQDADVTLIFIGKKRLTGGSKATQRICKEWRRPSLTICVNSAPLKASIQLVKEFLNEHKPEVLNIAGNRNSKEPGIEIIVEHILTGALEREFSEEHRGGEKERGEARMRKPERL